MVSTLLLPCYWFWILTKIVAAKAKEEKIREYEETISKSNHEIQELKVHLESLQAELEKQKVIVFNMNVKRLNW